MKFQVLLAISASAICLAGCGTTSSLASNPQATQDIDLTTYSRLLVTDFADEASGHAAPKHRPTVKLKVDAARISFPDLIASAVTDEGGFTQVSHAASLANPAADTLVVRGAITQWEDGAAAMRLLVGFGAGSARFNARIQLVDGGSGNVLGSWIVDKNSWALGGVIAAAQTPEKFMSGAAKVIGQELSRRRLEGSMPR